ncbi:MAG TPA: bifunctional 3-deoxy-7-phosphoheptulonate synthase/chorismate mutase [Acidimicrobiia bacterium]|nr:bifunctional 3-deoxy-7-phosphoheptulonate synthase/chorismate mutase [Acidimicrobiia bacterium]
MERKAHKTPGRPPTIVSVGKVRIGHDPFVVIAGPCAIESAEQIHEVAEAAAEGGASILRGGAWKSTSSPYDFRGMGQEAVDQLAAAGEEVGLPTVTQVLEASHVEIAAEKIDMLEIASGNMQDFELLRQAGRSGRPVLLRRGPSATLDEWLWAAEYLLAEGNDQVVLVERGIRTFGAAGADTLDIGAVPSMKETTHLPVMVDPSHSAGGARRVRPLALAAQGVGADGVILEVHPDPEVARVSLNQIGLGEFEDLMTALGISRVRRHIDQIDRQIVRLLARRQELALEIGRVKLTRNLPVYIPDRESELLAVVRDEAEHLGVAVEHIEELFNLVLAESKRLQHEMRQMEAAAPAS